MLTGSQKAVFASAQTGLKILFLHARTHIALLGLRFKRTIDRIRNQCEDDGQIHTSPVMTFEQARCDQRNAQLGPHVTVTLSLSFWEESLGDATRRCEKVCL